MLVRSAFSANIKERRDCSTALFDERGRMIAQAEHIPVHLGAMPDAVAAVAGARPRARRASGSSTTRSRAARTCRTSRSSRARRSASPSRARTTPTSAAWSPASLPAESRELAGGGRRDPADAARRRRARRARRAACATPTSAAATSAPSSPRTASPSGASTSSCERRGRATVAAAMDELYAYSERVVRAAIARAARRALRGRGRARGARRRAPDPRGGHGRAATRSRSTSPARRRSTTGNLNCPLAVTRSACYFVVRCLTDPDLPASGGAFAPVTVTRAARAASSTRAPPAAVVGGQRRRRRAGSSTSSSRRFGQALDVPAQGQGTMNNVTFGNERLHVLRDDRRRPGRVPGRRRAVGRPRRDVEHAHHARRGARARSYPLRVERYALRLGSGGAGAHRGGDGVVRELRVLEPLPRSRSSPSAAAIAPRGARGGGDGRAGPEPAQRRGAAGEGHRRTSRRATSSAIETPGGGGYGEPSVGLARVDGRVEAIFIADRARRVPAPVERVRAVGRARARGQPVLLRRRRPARRSR